MGIEKVFELFRQRNRPEAPADLPSVAGEIYLKSVNWVSGNLSKTPEELGKQPFLLSQQAIEIIQTSLIETKSKKLLGQRRYKKAADHETQLLLNNWFRKTYEKVFQELDLEHNQSNSQQMESSLKKYIETVTKMAPKFLRGRSSENELIKICNQIRGNGIGPVAFYLKVKVEQARSQ